MSFTDKLIDQPLKVVQDVLAIADDMGKQSLPEYTASTRLNPIVLIDKALTTVDDDSLGNILQTMCSIFSAHYLQAVAIATDINGIKTIRLLDKFATNRDVGTARLLGDITAAMESHALPMYDVSMEAGKADDIQGHVNLAIGRLLHVTIAAGPEGKGITIPVNVVLNPLVINSDALPDVMTGAEAETGFINRYHQWRSGEIESFTDYIFALDLIEKDRKALLNDDSGIYKEARERKSKGMFATILTGKVSINNASTMAVITNATATALELALKGRLKSARVRNKYFVTTNSMMLVVVDRRKERIKIYQRGIDNVGSYTFSDIDKNGSNAGAMDIGSILKAYKLGESPAL